MAAAVSSNPCDKSYVESLAAALGFNPYDDSSYTDSSGVTRFSETNCSLQISAAGELLLTAVGTQRFAAADDTTGALVEQARALTEQAVGSVAEDGRLYLSGVSRDGETTVCTFDYVLDGIRVSCGETPAASVTFTGSAMTECRILIAGFRLGNEPLALLPHTQAAAILPAGGSLSLEYNRPSTGAMTAGWKKSLS